MNASNRELLPLIYRHLKESGFHSAAEELHKHSAQSEPPTSTTLLDIYSSWLKSSKRKTKSTASKPSAQDKKPTAPKKASPQKKKTERNTKPGSPNKTPPTKRKKGDGKAVEKNVKSRKSKVEKKEAQGGEDSDSDSSLDVEKWKRLLQQMTEADLAKVEALEALVSPEPKKQRVRKPRAKPNPTAKTSTNQQNKTSDKLTEDTAIKRTAPKKSRSKKVLPVPLTDNSTQEQNIETPVGDVISPPKQCPKNEKREATTDQATLEPKKKKKKATTLNNVNINTTEGVIDNTLDIKKKNIVNNPTEIKITMGSNDIGKNGTKPKKKKKDATQNQITANAIDGGSVIDKHVETNDTPKAIELAAKSPEKTTNHPPEPKKKKKKTIEVEVATESIAVVEQNAQTNATNTVEDINGKRLTDDRTISLNTANAESIEKAKKKKKKKDKDKEHGEQTVTDAKSNSVSNVETCDKTQIESCQDIEPAVEISHKKKKKKKDKSKEESETLPQEGVTVETVGEENTEQILVKKKSKKKKRESEDHLGSEGEQITTATQDSQGEASEETPAPLSSTQPTPGKKKKHKLQSEQLDIADSVPEIQESETPKKKKKKSTKSNENES